MHCWVPCTSADTLQHLATRLCLYLAGCAPLVKCAGSPCKAAESARRKKPWTTRHLAPCWLRLKVAPRITGCGGCGLVRALHTGPRACAVWPSLTCRALHAMTHFKFPTHAGCRCCGVRRARRSAKPWSTNRVSHGRWRTRRWPPRRPASCLAPTEAPPHSTCELTALTYDADC